jgi:hypothetical protein
MRNKILLIFAYLLVVILVFYCFKHPNDLKEHQKRLYREFLSFSSDDIIDFEGFDNQKGSQDYIIPNIVHLLYLNTTRIAFYQMINIFSIYFNHNPDLIFIHCDNCSFSGPRWNRIMSHKALAQKIILKKLKFNDRIFGKKYGWTNHHRSDVLRLLVLMAYGGIYLDNDVYVVNSLNKYRKYEMVVSWEENNVGMGVQVLIAHRNARLLKAHFDNYR